MALCCMKDSLSNNVKVSHTECEIVETMPAGGARNFSAEMVLSVFSEKAIGSGIDMTSCYLSYVI